MLPLMGRTHSFLDKPCVHSVKKCPRRMETECIVSLCDDVSCKIQDRSVEHGKEALLKRALILYVQNVHLAV